MFIGQTAWYLSGFNIFFGFSLEATPILIGEGYMDGDLQIESGSIDDLLALLIANNNQWNRHWLARLMLTFDTRLSWFSTLNFPSWSRRNAAHHYDLKDSVFSGHKLVWCCSFSSAMIIPPRRWGNVTPRRQKTVTGIYCCLLYTSPSPRDATLSRMPSSA